MTHIVVLGAGYAGLEVTRRLAKRIGSSGRARITLVNATEYHAFHTELHKVAAGTAQPPDVAVSLHHVLPTQGVDLRIGWVTHIDPETQTVELHDGETLSYDRLVVALGSVTEYWGIPGLAEHSLSLTGLAAAVAMKEAVEAAVRRAQEQNRQAHVIVGGGGLTGVELAGELAYSVLAGQRLTLIELGPNLLLGQPSALSQEAERFLGQLGVTILTGLGLQEVTPHQVHLTNGDVLGYDALLWAGGVRGNPTVAQAFATEARDRAIVDQYLRAEGYDNVYIIGDAALAKQAQTGRPVPQTAQAALAQAQLVVQQLANDVLGRAGTPAPYEGKSKGVLVSVGPKLGLGQWGPVRGGGRAWKRIKDANDLKYRLHAGKPVVGQQPVSWEEHHVAAKTDAPKLSPRN